MAEYVCESCGMGVVGMKCAKCEKDLVHDHISKEDGTKVATLVPSSLLMWSCTRSFSHLAHFIPTTPIPQDSHTYSAIDLLHLD